MAFEKFADYFYFLAHRVFKLGKDRKSSDIWQFTGGIGPDYDQANQAIFKLRSQALIILAEGKALDAHGLDRKMPRYPGEEDMPYKLRLLNAFSYYSAVGTKTAILAALARLGYTDLDIIEAYLTDQTRWAEFGVVFSWDVDSVLNSASLRPLRDTVKRMKPAHTRMTTLTVPYKPVTMVNSELITARDIHRATLNFWGNGLLYLDGSWLLDGSFDLDGLREGRSEFHPALSRNSATLAVSEEYSFKLTTNYHLWQIDGAYDLDGTRNLDAAVIIDDPL